MTADAASSEGWGPAMALLTPMQRAFVLAQAADPFGNATRWARKAGFSEKTRGGLRVAAHRLAHDPKVQAAVFEFAQGDLATYGPMLATAGLLRAARDRKHPKHMKALEAIANRVGLHERTEHTVRVTHTDQTGTAMLERIKELAGALGVDPGKLLGVNAAPKVIEGEVVEGRDAP